MLRKFLSEAVTKTRLRYPPQGNLSISCCISVIHLILEQRTCDVSLDMRFQATDSLVNWIKKWRVWWQNLNLGIFHRRSSSTMGRRTVENKIVCFILIQMLVCVLQKLVEKCTCHAARLNLVIYQPKHWRYCQTYCNVPSFLPTHRTVSSVALSRTPLASGCPNVKPTLFNKNGMVQVCFLQEPVSILVSAPNYICSITVGWNYMCTNFRVYNILPKCFATVRM